jgi:hypothetical protein
VVLVDIELGDRERRTLMLTGKQWEEAIRLLVWSYETGKEPRGKNQRKLVDDFIKEFEASND